MAIPHPLSSEGLDFGPDYPSITKNSTHGPGHISTEDWNSLIGIVTAIVGNVLISFALNTQRYAHIRLAKEAGNNTNVEDPRSDNDESDTLASQNQRAQQRVDEGGDDGARETDALIPKSQNAKSTKTAHDEKSDDPPQRKNYLRSPYWWIGIVLMVVGEAGNFLAYGFAPASIVSPLGVVALISNCLVAPIMLKEHFRKRDLFGVIVAVAGAVTVVLSAKDSNPKLDADQIWELFKRWEFLAYLGVTVALIVVLMIASNKYGQRTIMIDIGLVGLFGGYTALSTKGVASLFSSKLFDVFAFPITYLLILILVVTAIMQIKYVNRALQRFNSTQVIPTQFVMFTLFVVVGSAILYRDFEKTEASDLMKFVAGVAMTFLGVWSITGGRRPETSKDGFAGDEEHEIDLVDDDTNTMPTTPKAQRAVPGSSTDHADSPASFATASSRLASSPSKPKKQFGSSYSRPSRSTPSLTQKKGSTAVHYAPRSNSQQQQFPRTPVQNGRPSSAMHANSDTTVTQLSQNGLPSNSVYNTPQSPSSVPRHIFNRHSIASGMTPGPYLSPLSSGLSVVVADNLRRGSSSGNIRPRLRTRSLRQPRTNEARASSLPDANAADDVAAVNSETSEQAAVPSSLDESQRPNIGDRGITVEVASDAMARRADNESPERSW